MFVVTFFLICILLNGGNCQDFRIVGGANVTDRSEFAYQALLLYKGAPFCGGTIIDQNHVLTAAHCCFPKNNLLVKSSEITVVVGNLNLYDKSTVKSVEAVVVHEYYDPQQIMNDIAVLRISGVFENVTDVQPISLTNEHITSSVCNVSGWGKIDPMSNILSDQLQFVEVPIIDWDTCNEAYFNLTRENIGENKICAGIAGKDSCQGDSGGPLVCFGQLAGIVSYGYGCGYEHYPGIYTEVAKYVKWIEDAKDRSSAVIHKSTFLVFLILMVRCYGYS